MTIEKATRMTCNNTQNIKSWYQKVLDLLDLMFAELFVILWNYMEHFLNLDTSPLFLQIREEIIRQLVKLVDYGIFQIFP